MNATVKILFDKLDEFIRKYYKNELLRGGLLFIALFVTTFLLIVSLEYFTYFGILERTVLFYVFILLSFSIFIWFILRPLLKLFRLSRGMTYEEAAKVIGSHFSDVSDSLVNFIHLNRQNTEYQSPPPLLLAAIEQKAQKLKPVPFSLAIRFKNSVKYLKFSIPPVLVLILLWSFYPDVVVNPAARIIHHSTFYEKPAPFAFVIDDKRLETIQMQDFRLEMKTTGKVMPEQVFLVINNNEYLMAKDGKTSFTYLFRSPQKDISFYFLADSYRSRDYTLKVIPKPTLNSFSVELKYPAYTGKAPEVLNNAGDLSVPEGTALKWIFHTRNVDKLNIKLGEENLQGDGTKSPFAINAKAKSSCLYTIFTSNAQVASGDSIQYSLNVVQDAFPNIGVDEFRDSADIRRLYFNGSLKDDYGFSKLFFRYRFVRQDEQSDKTYSVLIPINNTISQQSFYFFYNLADLSIQPGEELVYYFEVYDNDGVNGPKPARSSMMYYKAPDEKDIADQSRKMGDDIQQQLNDNIAKTRQLQQQMESINRKMLEKKTLNWEDRQQIKDLMNKQKELQNNIEELKNKNQEKARNDQYFKEFSPDLLEKQRMLEKLFSELMTEEMKELFKQMEQMIDQAEKEKINELMEKMKLSNEDIEKELDRSLELFKQLEFEKKLTSSIDKLKQLKEEQDKLREQIEESGKISEEQNKAQEKINQDFNELQKELEDLKKLNSELKDSKPMPETKEKEDKIAKSLEKSSQSMKQNKKKEAAGNQKEAGQEMEKLSEELEGFQEQMQEEEAQEDIATLRKILENLVRLSFRQESIMKQFSETSRQDPAFPALIDKQKQISQDLKVIEDSLFALSKRQLQLQSFINREINEINFNSEKVVKALLDMNTVGMVAPNLMEESQRRQQNIMTSSNNLALMLAESLKQMQQQQNSNKSGKNCKNPKPGKGSKPSAATMRKLQEQLNKQMQEMKEQMQKGGKTPKGQPSMSEQLARMAAQQEAIRRMMQEYKDELMKEGVGDKGNLSKLMQEMEKTETDLVNKIINQETLKRQQDILTRLLESEKAERERELDNKRESTESKMLYFSNPKEFLEYKRLKIREDEILRTVPPGLKPFYKNKVNEYFYTIED